MKTSMYIYMNMTYEYIYDYFYYLKETNPVRLSSLSLSQFLSRNILVMAFLCIIYIYIYHNILSTNRGNNYTYPTIPTIPAPTIGPELPSIKEFS